MNHKKVYRLHRAIKRIEQDLARLPWRPDEVVTNVPPSAALIANRAITTMVEK